MEICAWPIWRRASNCTRFDFSCFYTRCQENNTSARWDGKSSQFMLYNRHYANAALDRTDKWLCPEKVILILLRMYV